MRAMSEARHDEAGPSGAPRRKRFDRSAVFVAAALCATALAWGTPANAQIDDASRTAARALGTSGLEAYEAGRFQEASDKLEKAYAIARVPTLALWSARSLEKLGRLVEAAERYREAIGIQLGEGEHELQRRAQVEAQAELHGLEPRIPLLVIEVENARPADVSLSIDGTPRPSSIIGQKHPLDPGKHRVVAQLAERRLEQEVELAVGDTRTLVLPFDGEEAPPRTYEEEFGSSVSMDAEDASTASPLRTLGWVSLGLGGAGLAVGGIWGVMALGKKSDIDDSASCVGGDRCAPSERDLVDSYDSARSISTIGFIAGGLFTAAGITLLLTQPSDTGVDAQAFIGPGMIGARGSF